MCVFVSVEWWRACLLAIHHYFDEQANCTARLLAGPGNVLEWMHEGLLAGLRTT